jgi:hypothetical protein
MRRLESDRRRLRWTVLGLVALVAVGCATGGPRRVTLPAAPEVLAPLVHCHDGTGHLAGTTPWILGGTCCCTPTRAMFETHQAERTVPAEMSFTAYLALYADRGIQIGPAHAGCNNRCDAGPHVVFGGRCMAAPTPGTANYEKVCQGKRPPT